MRFWAKGAFRKVGPTTLTRQVGDFKMALRLTEEWHRVGTRTARPRADVVIGPYARPPQALSCGPSGTPVPTGAILPSRAQTILKSPT